jgi:DNA-binding MarR family transcriptional regulator
MENPEEIVFLMQQVYATLFSLANKLQVQGDKYLEKMTSRQLMAIIATAHLPEDGATLNNIARKLGTTKQNVKQLVTNLEKKGYVLTVPSLRDKRAVNVKTTEAGKHAWLECGEKGLIFFLDLFKDFTKEEMEILWGFLKKMYRFDGVEQDGFEEEAGFNMGEDQNEAQARVLKEFEKRRNKF